MTHKFVKVGDVVKIKEGDSKKIWSKLDPSKKYIVKKTSPHSGYEDNTQFITQFEDNRSNIINLKINERYFDVVWEEKVNKRFAVGDKVISVKDTDQTVEGTIGYVIENNNTALEGRYAYAIKCEPDGALAAFKEDELELLSAGKKEEPLADYLVDMFSKPNIKLEKSVEKLNTLLEAEYTGGSSSYYKVDVINPTTSDAPYQAECNDVIEALGLTFTEGNIFKAIWRIAADRQGKKKKGNNSVYDAEKVVFFAERLLIQEKSKEGK